DLHSTEEATPMDCPRGCGPMTAGKKLWICEECGHRHEFAPDAAPRPWTAWPSLVAVPWDEYHHETHPVLRLHRLCDAVELLTRFLTVLALGECRARIGGLLPDGVLDAVRERIELPTLGKWRAMLEATVGLLHRGDPLALPELPDLVTGRLLP